VSGGGLAGLLDQPFFPTAALAPPVGMKSHEPSHLLPPSTRSPGAAIGFYRNRAVREPQMFPSSLPRRQPALSVREAEKFAERGLAAARRSTTEGSREDLSRRPLLFLLIFTGNYQRPAILPRIHLGPPEMSQPKGQLDNRGTRFAWSNYIAHHRICRYTNVINATSDRCPVTRLTRGAHN